MTDFAIVFLLINAAALIALPQRWAPLPLLVGACYINLDQGIAIGPFNFSVIRLLILTGLIRAIIRNERLAGGINGLDWLMIVWSLWALASSFFHKDPSQALIFRLGLIFNACGVYFLLRAYCRSFEDVKNLCYLTVILLVPIAIEMIYEQMAVHNIFDSMIGGIAIPNIREGKVRSSGPFSHPILAGTIGATCLPFAIGLWHQYRKSAFMGVVACSIMIITSASSGPIVSAMAAIGALLMWRYRQHMRFVRWIAVFTIAGIALVMKAPFYYIIYRFNITGSSAGWHRAALIEAAISHLNEWWLAGTDYTRHWMQTGVQWSQDHTDITNHYLTMGVIGGLPLMFLFIAILAKGFSIVGQNLRQGTDHTQASLFILWALGASLFAHATTFISVSYYDQSFLFIYLTLAFIGSSSVVRNPNTNIISS